MFTRYNQPCIGMSCHIGQPETCHQAARDESSKKYAKIQEGLETSISIEGRARITRILGEINHLTDVEKLLLYLKLPSGISSEDHNRLTPTSCLPASNRKEQGEAFSWIKSHLEEHGDVCMPKAEVYEEYRQYCEQHELRPLCNADFGKMMKQAFPDINTRRLGQRGQSKYFYGGLRKKTDHAPPTLPELEITHIEIDSSAMESEIFKASCSLVCEWADKLLDMKFLGVQDIAEHLIMNTFVNTKSAAAFTLIAAMQESKKPELKGSALFSSQPTAGGDKHKETNLLLQKKLQQNKEIQKQKGKAQALREELQKQKDLPVETAAKPDCKTPTSVSKKSVTPSLTSSSTPLTSSLLSLGGSVTPTVSMTSLMTSLVVHGSSESLRAQFATPMIQIEQPPQKIDCEMRVKQGHGQTSFCMSHQEHQNPGSQGTAKVLGSVTGKTDIDVCANSENKSGNSVGMRRVMADRTGPQPGNIYVKGRGEISRIEHSGDSEYTVMDTDHTENKSDTQLDVSEAKTPEQSLDSSHSEFSHVRKINFDNIVAQDETEKSKEQSLQDGKNAQNSEKLSKSTGYLSLKKMLENKGEEHVGLNRSMGSLEKSNTALFANPSTVSGRSAFVPFSQVQSLIRKEGSNTNQSVAMAIPVIIPSAAQSQPSQTVSQSANIAMIALPAEIQTSPVKNPQGVINNETILSFLPASVLQSSSIPASSLEAPVMSGGQEILRTTLNTGSQTKDSVSVVTVSSVLSKMAGSECNVSSSVNAHNLQKQLRTKFTPIRPKASPNKSQNSKSQPVKESKSEGNSYDKDKRPVSAILKEKRAREQADAMAKLQSIQLPAIPFQPGLTLAGNQLGGLQGLQTGLQRLQPGSGLQEIQTGSGFQGIQSGTSLQEVQSGSSTSEIQTGAASESKVGATSVPPNEVVIIVNNQHLKLRQVIGGNTLTQPLVSVPRSTGTVTTNDGDKKNDSLAEGRVNVKSVDSDLSQRTDDMLSVESDTSMKELGSVPSELNEFSPMSVERDMTPILLDDDEDAPTLTENDARNIPNLKEILERAQKEMTGNEDVFSSETVNEQVCMETPRKIQKLNVTSPFQEDTAYSLGRDTPVRISKPSDSCLSRPESACSYGRETPSGARKRKSSDLQPRRDFKRLNSTGEENDESHNLSFIFSPGNDSDTGSNPRRTQSCTFELERNNKGKSYQQQQQQVPKLGGESLVQGLQSPDIHSLEREALIESFPNSLYSMKPHHKSHKNQSSSVGVNAKSLRQSQQKLKKQQQVLDERMKNFLQTQEESSQELPTQHFESPSEKANQQLTVTRSAGPKARLDPAVVTDRGKPYQRPSSVATVGSRGLVLEMEPSGLPSDVADWINETIEKRQRENQSAMSEPDYRHGQMLLKDPNAKFQNFQFEVDSQITTSGKNNSLKTGPANPKSVNDEKIPVSSKNDDDNFTVPKAPPAPNPRMKESLRLNTDQIPVAQRCHSLPIFASPVHSPVSPLAPPGGRNFSNQRASSMSPRGQALDQKELLSPTGRQNFSPVKKKDVRDVHSLSPGQQTVYTGTFSRQDSKLGSYLASIQHSLQKPVESTKDIPDGSYGKTSVAVSSNKQHLMPRSRESSLDTDERFISKTPFSDSGYHSSGPSPILNSTPVSTSEILDLPLDQGHVNIVHSVAMDADFTIPIPQHSPQMSTNRPQLVMNIQNVPGYSQNMSVGENQIGNFSANPSQLRSSVHSAFIPIQGSHNDDRYVTPIKPVVTLPNTSDEGTLMTGEVGGSRDLLIDPGQQVLGTDVTMVSPKSGDPPSYEVAIQQLKKSTPPKHAVTIKSAERLQIGPSIENQSAVVKQTTLPGNTDAEQTADTYGPFAQKLMQLSQQTQNVGKNFQTLVRCSNGTVGTNMFNTLTSEQSTFLSTQNDLINVQPGLTYSQSVLNSSSEQFDRYGAKEREMNSVLLSKPREFGLKQNSAIIDVQPSHSISENSLPQNVLNLNPSFLLSSYDLTNQNAEQTVMSSLHHHESSNLNLNLESSNIMNKTMVPDNLDCQQFQFPNQDIFSEKGALQNTDDLTSVKNILIGGKVINQGHDIEVLGLERKSKTDEGSPQELMDDIGLSWESLREIEGDLGDFSMFN